MRDQGEFVETGSHDILIEALGKLEHPGHVKTKGEYVTQRKVFKKPPGDFRSSQESQVLLEREKHWEKKFKTMEDRLQIQEGWWKQIFDQLEALFTSQLSTLAAPPQPEPDVHTKQHMPDVHATLPEPNVHATQPEPTS